MTTHRNPSSRSASRSWAWILLHHVGGRGAVLAFFVALPLIMPLSEAGRFGFWYALWMISLQPWLDTAPGQQIARAFAKGDEQAGWSLFRQTRRRVQALATIATLGLLAGLGNDDAASIRLPALVLLAICGSSLQSLVFAVGRGREDFALEGRVGASSKLLLPLLALALARQTPSATAAACALTITACGGALLAMRGLADTPDEPLECPSGDQTLNQETLRLGLLALLSVAYLRLDLVLLGWLRSSSEVGSYLVVSRWVEATFIVPQVLLWRFFPRLVRAGSGEAFQPLFRRAALSLGVVGLVAAVAMSGLALWPLRLLYVHLDLTRPLLLLTPAIPAVFLGTLTSQALIASDRTTTVLHIALLGLACNASLDLWWIPQQGVEGAAMATSCTELLVALIGVVVLLRGDKGRT